MNSSQQDLTQKAWQKLQSEFDFNLSNRRFPCVLSVYSGIDLYQADKKALVQQTHKLLTPSVTQALPRHYQGVESEKSAESWLLARFQECNLLAISRRESPQLLGFLFIHQSTNQDEANEAVTQQHIGYLLTESVWGKGIASALINAYIQRCRETQYKGDIIAGVESNNLASIRVLEKSGFLQCKTHDGNDNNRFYSITL